MTDENIKVDQALDAILHSLNDFFVDPRGHEDFLSEMVKQHGREVIIKGLALALPNKCQPELFCSHDRALIANTYKRYVTDSFVHRKFVDHAKGNIANAAVIEAAKRANGQFIASIFSVEDVSDDDLIEIMESVDGTPKFLESASKRAALSSQFSALVFKAISESSRAPADWLISTARGRKETMALLKTLIMMRDGSDGAKKFISTTNTVIDHLAKVDKVELLNYMMENIDNPSKSFYGAAAPYVLFAKAVNTVPELAGNTLKLEFIESINRYAKKLSTTPEEFIGYTQYREAVKAKLIESLLKIPVTEFNGQLVLNEFLDLAACISAINNEQFELEASSSDSPLKILATVFDDVSPIMKQNFNLICKHLPLSDDDVVNSVTKAWHLKLIDGLVDIDKIRHKGNRRFNGLLLSDQLGL